MTLNPKIPRRVRIFFIALFFVATLAIIAALTHGSKILPIAITATLLFAGIVSIIYIPLLQRLRNAIHTLHLGKKTVQFLHRLADTGIIRKFTLKMGVAEGAEAITLLATNPASPTQEVSKRIREISNVETVYEVTGEYDIVVVISGMNVVEVNECIEKIRRVEGIMKTNTMIVLRSW